MGSHIKLLLIEATLQDIYLEILRRTHFGYFSGETIANFLHAQPHTWLAAAMGSHTARRGDLASAYLLARLRGLTRNQSEGLDTLYILAKDQRAAEIWLNKGLFPDQSEILSPAVLSQDILHVKDPSEARLVRLWWNLQIAEAPDADSPDSASFLNGELSPQSLTLEEAPLQALYLDIIRRQEFNAYEGHAVFEGLIQHRALWVAALLDRLTVSDELEGELHMLWQLRSIQRSRLHKHDTLYILAKDQEAATILVAQPWASEIGIVQPNRVNKFVDFPAEQRLVTIWWD